MLSEQLRALGAPRALTMQALLPSSERQELLLFLLNR
jgi:hypothetical protein